MKTILRVFVLITLLFAPRVALAETCTMEVVRMPDGSVMHCVTCNTGLKHCT
jgi:hypothetical protein